VHLLLSITYFKAVQKEASASEERFGNDSGFTMIYLVL